MRLLCRVKQSCSLCMVGHHSAERSKRTHTYCMIQHLRCNLAGAGTASASGAHSAIDGVLLSLLLLLWVVLCRIKHCIFFFIFGCCSMQSGVPHLFLDDFCLDATLKRCGTPDCMEQHRKMKKKCRTKQSRSIFFFLLVFFLSTLFFFACHNIYFSTRATTLHAGGSSANAAGAD